MVKIKSFSGRFWVAIEKNGRSAPRPHELEVARVLADHFESNIIFVRRASSKTPDIYVIGTGVTWEIKSPIGNGKHTIQNNLRDANSQSENIILDLSRSKMIDARGISRARSFIQNERSTIRRLKVLMKNRRLVDIKEK